MDKEILLMIMLFLGVLIECFSLLGKKPNKVSVFTFVGMLIYMAFLLIIPRYQEAQFINQILNVTQTFAVVFAFLFIAIFLKEVLKNLNESIIASLTLSFWLLIFTKMMQGTLAWPHLIIAILISVIPSYLIIKAVFSPEKISKQKKTLLYAWFLFVNTVFGVFYFTTINNLFFTTGGLRSTGSESYSGMLTLGMVVVYLLFNGGILYYSIVSLFSIGRKQRQAIYNTVDVLFSNQQISKLESYGLLLPQIIVFLSLLATRPDLLFDFLVYWVLLTPLLVRMLSALKQTR